MIEMAGDRAHRRARLQPDRLVAYENDQDQRRERPSGPGDRAERHRASATPLRAMNSVPSNTEKFPRVIFNHPCVFGVFLHQRKRFSVPAVQA